eukprot:6642541-Pyramimonas_sp.AAC.1
MKVPSCLYSWRSRQSCGYEMVYVLLGATRRTLRATRRTLRATRRTLRATRRTYPEEVLHHRPCAEERRVPPPLRHQHALLRHVLAHHVPTCTHGGDPISPNRDPSEVTKGV